MSAEVLVVTVPVPLPVEVVPVALVVQVVVVLVLFLVVLEEALVANALIRKIPLFATVVPMVPMGVQEAMGSL